MQDQRWKYIRYFATDRSLFQGHRPGVSPEQADAYKTWLTASIRGLEPDHEELFDLASDPHETTNLAGVPDHAAKLRELRGEMDRLVREAKGDLDAPPLTIRMVPETE